MPKRTSAADPTPVRVVIVTLDNHLAGAAARAERMLKAEIPGLTLTLHAASEWAESEAALARCRAAVAAADVIIVSMLFMEQHIEPILPQLRARREACDCLVVGMSAGEVIRLTRMGGLRMDSAEGGAVHMLKRLCGAKRKEGSSGARQMKMLRQMPRLLRFIPGRAQDLRAYFLTLQCWLAASDENVANMVRRLINRYADGPRRHLRGALNVADPVEHPDVGLYHPRAAGRIVDAVDKLPAPAQPPLGTVGLLVMRSYVLAGDAAHYDGVIEALEAEGLRVIPAFAAGLDSRPAVNAFFRKGDRTTVDAIVSLTGFSLVGGPAYNDAAAAEAMLAELDVPYIAAHAVEFNSLESWRASDQGLMPIEAAMMVSIPELEGATGPIVFGGRSMNGERPMQADKERTRRLAARVARLVRLRHIPPRERKVAIVLFNFPPNAGATGTAAHLAVFESLLETLRAMQRAGYSVEVPATVDQLRQRLLNGNAQRHGTTANVSARIPVDDYVRREPHLAEIEEQWGPSPGRQQSDGQGLFVLGERFGNVFVGVQPAFGYEGDPMRLLFEKGFAPTHAFSAFYRYLREDFAADCVLHFGTHGALEFMPGKQVGLSASCWPDRLIADLPNFYLYAANNPSEGTIAKRRAAATLLSYLTPAVTDAGLYRGLLDLKDSLDRWRKLLPERQEERERLAELIQAQAAAVDLAAAEPAWGASADVEITRLSASLHELETTLIPHGLHVVGMPPGPAERASLLQAIATGTGLKAEPAQIEALINGSDPVRLAGRSADATTLNAWRQLAETNRQLSDNQELQAILRALDGRFVRPAPGGDVLRTPAILPTGRNIHGFDPFRMPSAFAVADGARQAERLLARHAADGHSLPESVVFVLWGTDNLKSEGGPIAQAMALMGTKPRFDSYGRLTGAALIPLAELGRPRINVIMTLSGIFRDLLPLQTRMLAEAAYLAATADEPITENFVRKHALQAQQAQNCDMETAALRVFSNANGAYGSNVSHLVETGAWSDEDELAEVYTRRKCYAYGRQGQPVKQAALLRTILAGVDLAYQNLESVEVGVTTIDHYFDTLGGISRAVTRARGEPVSVYIGDQTQGEGRVRTLAEQVALETRTRALNPKWYEAMLRHGYEGVRQIEAQVTNTLGWSATTGQVSPWVYQRLAATFVLDEEMRHRLAALNPTASAKVANRLLEAHERAYWSPDPEVLQALRQAGQELEDRLEGIGMEAAA
jgi:magnesium chelatase subunit H